MRAREPRLEAKRAFEALSFPLPLPLPRHPIVHALASHRVLVLLYIFNPLRSSYPSLSLLLSPSSRVSLPAPSGPSCPFSAIIYSSHILFASGSQHHSITIPSRKLIIDSSIQAPFYHSSCIGFFILNSFVRSFQTILLTRLQFSSITITVSMPIEVTTSPSITDTLHSYRDFSYQPSFFAKISTATNWITQEQAIAMEDPATDVSVLHRCHQGAPFLFPFGFVFFFLDKDSCHSPSLLVPH